MGIPVFHVNTIEIPVQNLERALLWYQDVLDIVCVWSDTSHALLDGASSIKNTAPIGIRILLVQTKDKSRLIFKNTETNIVHSVIDFETEDIEVFYNYLKSKNVNVDVLSPPENDWAPQGFGFLDSEGNRLGAYAYRKET